MRRTLARALETGSMRLVGDHEVDPRIRRARHSYFPQNLKVHHGDSGTLWLLEVRDEDDKLKLQPIALHWGQQQFVDGTSIKRSSYSLATCLSNVWRAQGRSTQSPRNGPRSRGAIRPTPMYPFSTTL